MKLLRYLPLIALVCALSSVAKADDFKLGVQDAGAGFNYTGGTQEVTFGSCFNDSSPTDGCVTLFNASGTTITALEIDVPANAVTIGDGGGNCLDGTGFATCTPPPSSPVNGEYQFFFTGLDIPFGGVNPNGFNTFEIEEQGIPPGDFPTFTVAATPEPASFWLLSTGVLLFGGFLYRRHAGALDS